jgi:hypothetical protein
MQGHVNVKFIDLRLGVIIANYYSCKQKVTATLRNITVFNNLLHMHQCLKLNAC